MLRFYSVVDIPTKILKTVTIYDSYGFFMLNQ